MKAVNRKNISESIVLLPRIIVLALLLISFKSVCQEYIPYGVERQMPVFLDSMTSRLTYPMAWENAGFSDFSQWRDSARVVLTKSMMTPPPSPSDYAAEVIYEEQRNGYVAKIVQLNLSGWTRVNVYLLVPNGKGSHPGVVLFHDHGGHFLIGKEKMIRPIIKTELSDKGKGNIIYNKSDTLIVNDANRWSEQCYGGQYFGDYLAQQGYAVVCGDALFWGERGRKEGEDKRKLSEFAGNLMGIGYCMSGITTFEDSYLSEWFSSLPEVDSERIASCGFSMGAYRAWMLSAASDVVKASINICWMTTTKNQFSWQYGRENGGYANTLPTIRYYMDHPHVASIAAPKPTLFINGETDKLFKIPGVQSAYETMRIAWEAAGIPENLETEIWPMPHWCGPEVQARAVEFLDKHFKANSSN